MEWKIRGSVNIKSRSGKPAKIPAAKKMSRLQRKTSKQQTQTCFFCSKDEQQQGLHIRAAVMKSTPCPLRSTGVEFQLFWCSSRRNLIKRDFRMIPAKICDSLALQPRILLNWQCSLTQTQFNLSGTIPGQREGSRVSWPQTIKSPCQDLAPPQYVHHCCLLSTGCVLLSCGSILYFEFH